MRNFVRSALYSTVVLAAGLVAMFSIYNSISVSPDGAAVAQISPAAGDSSLGISYSGEAITSEYFMPEDDSIDLRGVIDDINSAIDTPRSKDFDRGAVKEETYNNGMDRSGRFKLAQNYNEQMDNIIRNLHQSRGDAGAAATAERQLEDLRASRMQEIMNEFSEQEMSEELSTRHRVKVQIERALEKTRRSPEVREEAREDRDTHGIMEELHGAAASSEAAGINTCDIIDDAMLGSPAYAEFIASITIGYDEEGEPIYDCRPVYLEKDYRSGRQICEYFRDEGDDRGHYYQRCRPATIYDDIDYVADKALNRHF